MVNLKVMAYACISDDMNILWILPLHISLFYVNSKHSLNKIPDIFISFLHCSSSKFLMHNKQSFENSR